MHVIRRRVTPAKPRTAKNAYPLTYRENCHGVSSLLHTGLSLRRVGLRDARQRESQTTRRIVRWLLHTMSGFKLHGYEAQAARTSASYGDVYAGRLEHLQRRFEWSAADS